MNFATDVRTAAAASCCCSHPPLPPVTMAVLWLVVAYFFAPAACFVVAGVLWFKVRQPLLDSNTRLDLRSCSDRLVMLLLCAHVLKIHGDYTGERYCADIPGMWTCIMFHPAVWPLCLTACLFTGCTPTLVHRNAGSHAAKRAQRLVCGWRRHVRASSGVLAWDTGVPCLVSPRT